jgi:hypothetical protein
MAESLFNKEYINCATSEKLECNKKGREAMLATVYMMKADKGRYSKLLTDLHDDHLKGYMHHTRTTLRMHRNYY